MDFRQRVPLGRTGLEVSRLGLATGYGVPASSIEKAFHEYGINYFYLSFLSRKKARVAMGNLLPRHRDDLVLVLPHYPILKSRFLPRRIDKWLRRLGVDRIDVLVLQGLKRRASRTFEQALRLKEEGKVRFLAMSSHKRSLFGAMGRGELDTPIDVYQMRYNVVHRGAEQDIFPHLPETDRAGTVVFTATCWRKPLKARNMPPGESPLTAAECYRFVLSNPHVDVCITGPSTADQMEANLAALEAGPLTDEEMARACRIGDHIYGA